MNGYIMQCIVYIFYLNRKLSWEVVKYELPISNSLVYFKNQHYTNHKWESHDSRIVIFYSIIGRNI